MLKMVLPEKPPYTGVNTVISGGQIGADQGGLAAAKKLGLTTGGVAPAGYRTSIGNMPQLQTLYGLTEHSSRDYPPRTRRNVEEADGTVIIGRNLASPGSLLTMKFCRMHDKHYTTIDLELPFTHQQHAEYLNNWVKVYEIGTLNVAGNRDKFGQTTIFDAVEYIVTHALTEFAPANP